MKNNVKNKLIITVATTGAWPTKDVTPYVPLQPKEIAEEIYACWKAGAAMAHIHVRDDDDKASMHFENFQETVERVRATDSDIILNLTTSGGIGLKDDDRMKPFSELLPEMASYDCGTMNWAHSAIFENRPEFLEKLGLKMQEVNVKPEIEVFDAGMVYNALYYLKKGVLKAPLHFQFCLGVPGGTAATLENLIHLKSLIPENSTWSTFGVGKGAVPIMLAAIALGGHIRVGMEDNIYLRKGVLAKSNVEFIEQVKKIAFEASREIATPAEAREIFSLENKV